MSNPIDPTNYFDIAGRQNTDCDLMSSGWGQDCPDGESTVLGVLMDGSKIVPEGQQQLLLLRRTLASTPSSSAFVRRLIAAPSRPTMAPSTRRS